MNPNVCTLEVISNHQVGGIPHAAIMSKEITSSQLIRHIAPVEFTTAFNSTFRCTASWQDIGNNKNDYVETVIVFQEEASDIEFKLPVKIFYNREVDLGDTVIAGSQ